VEEQVRVALEELQVGLAEDGFRLRVASVREGEVEVIVEAGEDACWECLVGDDLLEEMVRGAVARVAPGVQRVVVRRDGRSGRGRDRGRVAGEDAP
jgi:Fe-S cluster biogenesis protein NfuA